MATDTTRTVWRKFLEALGRIVVLSCLMGILGALVIVVILGVECARP